MPTGWFIIIYYYNSTSAQGWFKMPYHQLVEMTKIIQLSLPYYHAYQAACKLFTWSLKYPDVFVTSGALGEVMNIPPHHPILCCDLINWWSTLCIVVSYRMIGMRSPFLVCSSPGLWRSQVLDCSKCSPTKAFAPSYLSWRHSDCQTSLFPTCNVN